MHVLQHLKERGDQVLVASRKKDIALDLMNALGISHRSISDKGKGALGLFIELIARDYCLLQLARIFRPDLIVNSNSPCVSEVAWLTGRPSHVFDDTFDVSAYQLAQIDRMAVARVERSPAHLLSTGNRNGLPEK